MLVMEVGRPVPAVRLMKLLWADRTPSAATLRSHVSHLRRALALDRTESGVLVAVGSGSGSGYQLNLPPDRIDAWCFERGYAEGRRLIADGAAEQAAAVLGAALALWRGPAYADVADQPFAIREIARLDSMRRSASRGYAEALCASGRYAEAVDHLTCAVADQPYDEALRRLLALALCRAASGGGRTGVPGRTETAARPRHRGARAGAGATGDPPARGCDVRRVGADCAASAAPNPARFVARTQEIERARRHLCDPASAGEPLVVTGPAGVGKSTFAIRLAHEVADRFPDGQLYVNLRGFDPAGPTLAPEEAIRGFLNALNVQPQRMPVTIEAQVGLYRGLLASRRILVVLDNARDAAQVRPLLPGAPSCGVVITSRDQMVGLATADGANALALDLLTPAEARLLLARRMGAERLDTDPVAVDEIVKACAGLPLALAVVAARAQTNPRFPLRALAAQLHDVRVGLDAFVNGDVDTDVRAAFSWSYQALADGTARLFRLLSLAPGPDVTAPAAAALANSPVREVARLLADLCRLHLVTEHVPGRYMFHDLLRAYATELVHAIDSPAERKAAQCRCLAAYLHTAYRAARLLDPRRDVVPLPSGEAVVASEDLADHAAALAWFAAEHEVLLGAVELAARVGLDAYAWQLAWAVNVPQLSGPLVRLGQDPANRAGRGEAPR